jgi:hypothetical protein
VDARTCFLQPLPRLPPAPARKRLVQAGRRPRRFETWPAPSEVGTPRRTVALAALLAAVVAPAPVEAAGTGFDPRIVTFGESREAIKSTPITQRPNRPLHVYGNTVRRRHHRAATAPARPAAGLSNR